MRSLRVAAATVASALVLAACGAEAPEVDPVGDPTESTTEEAPEEEAEPSPSVANLGLSCGSGSAADSWGVWD